VRVIGELLGSADDKPDPVFPLLAWWAVERTVAGDPRLAADLAAQPERFHAPVYGEIVQRVARRLFADDVPGGAALAAKLVGVWDAAGRPDVVLQGIAAALEGGRLTNADPALKSAVSGVRFGKADDLRIAILARMGDPDALAGLRQRAAGEKRSDADRAKAIDLLRQVRDDQLKPLLLTLLPVAKSDALRAAILSGLGSFDDPAIGKAVLEIYAKWSAAAKLRAVQTLVTRKPWAEALFAAVDSGEVPVKDVPIDQVRAAVALNDLVVTKLAEKHFGKVGPATPGEKRARISWLATAMGRTKGDATAGKALYTQHCAKCHALFGEGNKVGPDLTTADRKNREFMLMNVVDPSAVIRPEYVSHSASLTDGRKLVGLVVESSAQSVTLLDAENRKTVIARGDLEDLKPLPTSLMPEKLLDTLTDQQVADLFAYLASDPPMKPAGK
jgi:putative heme-binding domain-containing protein